MKAVVYKSTGSWYVTKTVAGAVWQARIKGIFKIDEITSTNPVAVGDEVEIVPENELEQTAIITEISQIGKLYQLRQSLAHKMQHHIVAANIDQVIVDCFVLKEPRTSQGFIDRFLVASEAYHISAIIVFNKSDLYGKKEQERFETWKEMYEAIGYKVIGMSVTLGTGVTETGALLQNKITLLSGHSGVGKSSFINAIFPGFQLKTQEVSGWSKRGMHTTTFAEMFDLPAGGQVIDTPGMREFGLVDIPRQELSHYFPEMRQRLAGCQFNNCLHVNEPGCAIKKALVEGEIFEDRYISYCRILDSTPEQSY